jgi:hypothetical protein
MPRIHQAQLLTYYLNPRCSGRGHAGAV